MPRNAVSTPGRTEGYVVPAGPSIIEKLWEGLVESIGEAFRLHDRAALLGEGEGLSAADEQRGVCLGLATALSIILNPYDPDVNEVRREAMRRYRNKGSTA